MRVGEVISRVGEFQSRRALKLAQEVLESGLTNEQLGVALKFMRERDLIGLRISGGLTKERQMFNYALFDVAFGLKSVDDEATEPLHQEEL